ncbi:hypothetical protein D3C85_1573990 [compost metagenome]
MRQQGLEQRFVENLLTCQCAVLCGQRLVLEGLQLRRDIALGVLERLAPAVVVGHFVRLAIRYLYIEAMHAVVFHAQVGDARTRALACLKVDQELATVLGNVS